MGYYRSGKAIYFTNKSEAGNTEQVLIADCENEEKADFILNRITTHSSNFIRDAIVTCSPEYHGDIVSRAEFIGRVNGAIDALNKLDQVKKSLFYGRDNNLNPPEGKRDASDIPASVHSDTATAIDIVHAILGFATEAGELLEALKNAYNGNGFDWVNVQEELGDAAWYAALLANRGDFEFEDYEGRIIKKLRQSYADKFSAAEANQRNLVAERAILEDSQAPMQDEGDLIAGPEPLDIQPTLPVGGKPAVEEAEAKANTVFERVSNVKSNMVEQPTGTKPDLAQPRAYRNKPLDDEHIARQPVRREDLD